MQQAGTLVSKLDDMEFGKRLATEREIEKINGGQSATCNVRKLLLLMVVFDESGNFIIYPTLVGIKILNIHTNKVSTVIGKQENLRFMNIALYQGAPKKKSVVTIEMAASDNTVLKDSELIDPTLYCTAYKKNRFYAISRREPDSSTQSAGSRVHLNIDDRMSLMRSLHVTNLRLLRPQIPRTKLLLRV